jgi:hypothetical protein
MRRVITWLLIAAVPILVAASSSSAGPLTGKRSVVVTVRNDATAEKQRFTFVMADTDRLYVTRIEAEVVHTADGTSDEVVYPAGFKLGNVTVTRVQS